MKRIIHKYASFELPVGIQEYPPRVFYPRDANWSQSWAKRAVTNLKYRSELQQDTTLLNAGVWQNYALLSFELAVELAEKSGMKDGPIKELLLVARKCLETEYDALRKRRDYF